MKLSVIIPCYNAEKYLEECLSSLRRQSFSDFEAILIDDGSTDGTSAMIRQDMEKDSRIHLISQKNSGVSAARNKGIEAAKGEWIFFLDSDDILPENAFEALLRYAAPDVDMIVGSHCVFDSQHEERIRPVGKWMHLRGEKQKDAVIRRLIEGDSVLNIMCNKLHRRSVLTERNIRLNEAVRIAEDALFNLEAAIASGKIVYAPEVTYRYRMNENSAMRKLDHLSCYEIHRPWLLAMRDLLCARKLMGRYYGNYLDTVVLHVYKDGGIPEVLRRWQSEIRPLVTDPVIRSEELSGLNRVLYRTACLNVYPVLYPMIFVFQAIQRKKEEAFSLLH